ncbi:MULTISPECIES: NACHT domain-containing NTPase [Arthrobacter]|uniref:HNH endonuclease n=1 Tax=Arthrobacter terricola TaxID=2547396 RepID=A0A4R5L0Z6_9MICC|nr:MULTISPECIES: HNH endonuclease [Arthrobacter]MBT8159560.1 HNH endonuclease [Arthrobacter sp. GN70]TDG01319.1 HNH endonuclease [Arthrobacter terricola]
MGISATTRKALWTRAHNECAFPTCIQELTFDADTSASGTAKVIVLGEEAHIRAQSPGGPRYDAGYADVDGYENLMLMCPTHHSMIDANYGQDFPVKDLLKMKANHESNQARREELRTTLRAYLGDRYAAENTVQFQQAELRGPSVEAMFVDVPVGCKQDGSELAGLLAQIAKDAPGDTDELERSSGLIITGATQALLHPDWAGNAVLIGGPGQGKSTVLQYVCQFHRARRLGLSGYAAGQSEPARATTVARFPVRIDLRKYAQWAERPQSQRGKNRRSPQPSKHNDSNWRSFEEYIVDDIKRHIGANDFTPQDLVLLLSTEPVLFALDGLDEVASLTIRAKVVDEIVRMRGRLSPDSADLVILVATRPGTSLQPLVSSGVFPILRLQRLTQGLRLQYLRQWVEVSQLSEDAAARLQSTFMDSQHVPHVSELASYPMQLAILLHLLYRRQLLPQQRTELYAEYLKTFLDREQTEDKEPLLADQRRVVEDTHAYLGWYLQTKAEQGQSSGSITREELRRLLRTYLAGQPKEQELAEELYSAITDRVLCLVERDDAFEFEVQSLREYFAALHIFENLTPKGNGNSRDDGLNALLERPYWANVCRFFVGMLTRGEVRALVGNFLSVEKKVSPRPLVRAMAVTILNDRIYDGLTNDEIRGVVDFILSGPGVVLAEDGALDSSGSPLRLSERAGRAQAVEHLKSRLDNDSSPACRDAIIRSLVAHSLPTDNLSDWWWERFAPTVTWLEGAGKLGAFAQLTPEQSEQLAAALSNVDLPTCSRSALLCIGGYDGHEQRIVQMVFTDLNDGAAETLEVPAIQSDLGVLSSCAVAILDGRSAGYSSDSAVPRSTTALATGQAAKTIGAAPGSSAALDWEQYLSAIAATWDDGWVLRRAVSKAPATVDLASMSVRSKSPALASAAHDEAEYRAHKADTEWWRATIVAASSGRALMLAVIATFENARASVIVAIASDLDEAVRRLDAKQFQTVERALRRYALSHRHRTLDLQEPLRLHRVDFSGRVLWLVWIIGTDSTRERIPSYLEADLADVFLAGAADARAAVSASRTKRKLKLDNFRHARRSLSTSGWANPAYLATMTISMAKAILEEPEPWPADLVQVAADRLDTQAGSRVIPLADVASDNHWFGT